jgi:uncharacterized protein (TIGR03083 family)
MLRAPDPVLVTDLFPLERAALLALLESLSQDDWSRPTIAGTWTVKDIAAHLVADDLGRVSRMRDGHGDAWNPADGTLADFIDRRNAEWVGATRRLSPAVVRSLLEFGGQETQRLFESLDPFAQDGPVSWAGPGPAPIWLDLARELTERWHHQQQIRDALGAASLDDPRLLRPVLETFAFSLPSAFRAVAAAPGASVAVRVDGPSGGAWSVIRDDDDWRLFTGTSDAPTAAVRLDEDTAWRMYVRALPDLETERRSTIAGDVALGRHVLRAFALVS